MNRMKYVFMVLMSCSTQAFAAETCPGEISRLRAQTGVCITTEPARLQVKAEQVARLESALMVLKTRFPQLMSQVQRKGYSKVVIADSRSMDQYELSQINFESKVITMNQNFSAVGELDRLQNSKLSLEMTLLNQMIHAFDEDNVIAITNTKLIGWVSDDKIGSQTRQYRATNVGAVNLWVTDEQVTSIQQQALHSGKATHLEKYVLASQYARKFGYPTLHAVIGGPAASFAEIGAYIAFDPAAKSYIRPETYAYYMTNILK